MDLGQTNIHKVFLFQKTFTIGEIHYNKKIVRNSKIKRKNKSQNKILHSNSISRIIQLEQVNCNAKNQSYFSYLNKNLFYDFIE